MKWIEWQQMFLSLPFFFSSLLNTGLFFVARLKVEGVIGRNEEETVGAVVSLSFCPYKQHVLDTLCSRERGARQVEACNSFLPFRPSLAGRRERNYRTYFTVGIFQTSGNWRRSRSKGGKNPRRCCRYRTRNVHCLLCVHTQKTKLE